MLEIARLVRRFERNRRFWRNARVSASADCWPWAGPLDGDGYARYRGRRADEHAYRLAGGEMAPGETVEHVCGNRRCVNPRHLAPRVPAR